MTAQAPAYFRVIAIDYDGTLAEGQSPGAVVEQARLALILALQDRRSH
jgi:hydroxymethylpyrimidine pyrophosphatase-like HAD family hydrolase